MQDPIDLLRLAFRLTAKARLEPKGGAHAKSQQLQWEVAQQLFQPGPAVGFDSPCAYLYARFHDHGIDVLQHAVS